MSACCSPSEGPTAHHQQHHHGPGWVSSRRANRRVWPHLSPHLRLLPTSASFRPIGPDHSAPLASLPSSQAAVTAGRHHRKPPLTQAACKPPFDARRLLRRCRSPLAALILGQHADPAGAPPALARLAHGRRRRLRHAHRRRGRLGGRGRKAAGGRAKVLSTRARAEIPGPTACQSVGSGRVRGGGM